MEADVGLYLINHGEILKKLGLNISVVRGDEDSLTMAKARQESSRKIIKLPDRNHMINGFWKEIYNFQKSFKEMR